MSQAPDDTHFADFVRAHTAALLRTATLLTRSPVAAEELVQDTLAHLFPRWGAVRAAASPIAYVRRSLVNRHLSSQRRVRPVTELPDLVDPDADFARRLDDRDELRRLLDGLATRQRTALVLRYFHDLDDAGVADAMGCRVGTVRSLISRALATLRREHPALERQIS